MIDYSIFTWTVILGVAVLSVLTVYKYIIKPKGLQKQYVKEFIDNKWKVLDLGFLPFDTMIRKITFSGAKQNNDCHYQCKTKWSQYDIVICNFVDRPYIQIVNPELAKQFYQIENEKTFRKYRVLTSQLQRMVGRSITFSQGPAWKYKRRIMTQFLNFSFIKSVGSKIESIYKREVKAFYEKSKLQGETRDNKSVSQIYIQQLIEMINSTVVAQIFFGGGNQKVDSIEIDGKTLPHFMRELMDQLFWQTIDPISIMLGVKFVQLGLRQKDRKCNKKLKVFRQFATNFVHNRLYQISEQIKKNGPITEARDLVEAFYLETDQHQIQTQKKLFIDNMINDFANLYTAGTDTTQHATMMTMYYINKYPDVKKKLLKEFIDFKVNVDQLKYDEIKNLSYLEAICFESLRMYQTANGIFPREVLSPINIGGVNLKKDTIITTQTFSVHFNKQIYQNPDKFNPQRWLDKDGKVKSAQPFCFNTFSQGIRSCIGKQLALQEIKIFIIYFCSKYETQFETLDFVFNMCGFAYEPQPIKMKFWQK